MSKSIPIISKIFKNIINVTMSQRGPQGVGDMEKSVYDTLNREIDVFGYADTKANDAIAAANQYTDDTVIGTRKDRGNFTPSGSYPTTGGSGTAGAIKKGDTFFIAGLATADTEASMGTSVVTNDDTVRALTNNPGQTNSNWSVTERNTGYSPENKTNKATTMTGNTASTVIYLAAKGTYDRGIATFALLAGSIAQAFKVLSLDIGHATDTTLSRLSAGRLGLEGQPVLTSNNTETVSNKSIDGTTNTLTNLKINAPQGFLINGQIVTSVSSNNLTVAIKTLAGTDPSASDPVYVRIGNTIRTLTSALSKTTGGGSNVFNSGSTELATREIDYFVYLGWNTSGSNIILAFSRIPYATTMGDFNASFGSEKYADGAGTAGSVGTDLIENVGRFNAILSAGGGYTRSIPATSVIINRPIFETRLLSRSPQRTGGVTISASTASNATYKLIGNSMSLAMTYYITPSSTGSAYYFSSPMGSSIGGALAISGNNGVYLTAVYDTAIYIENTTFTSGVQRLLRIGGVICIV